MARPSDPAPVFYDSFTPLLNV